MFRSIFDICHVQSSLSCKCKTVGQCNHYFLDCRDPSQILVGGLMQKKKKSVNIIGLPLQTSGWKHAPLFEMKIIVYYQYHGKSKSKFFKKKKCIIFQGPPLTRFKTVNSVSFSLNSPSLIPKCKLYIEMTTSINLLYCLQIVPYCLIVSYDIFKRTYGKIKRTYMANASNRNVYKCLKMFKNEVPLDVRVN